MSTEAKTEVLGLRALPRRQIQLTMLGVMLAMFLGSLDQTVVGTAMPRIISDLGGFSHYTWVTTAYIITSAITIPITGKLTDMYGRKYFYIAGLVIFTIASLLSGLSSSMTQLIIFRGIQGLGAGVMMVNAFIVIGDLFPPAERGKYQGLIAGTFGLSSVIGPALGGFITDTVSWHWVFFLNVPLGVLIIALFVFFFPNVRPDNLKHRIDYAGAVTLVLTVVPLMLALSWGGVEYPWSSPPIIGMFAFAALMGILFIFIERHSQEPLIPLWLFRNRVVGVAEVVIFLAGFGMFGAIIFVPLFFQGVFGVSAAASGKFLTPMMLGMVTGSFFSGQLLSRAGGHYRLLGAVGIALMVLGMGLLSRMTAGTGYLVAIASIVATGFGLGITMPLYTIAVQNAVPYSVLGVATASVPFFRSIGGSVGLALFGAVMNNRFAAELLAGAPSAFNGTISTDWLSALARNPQALFSPEAQASLKVLLEQLGPQASALFPQLLDGLRHSLNSALSQVFLFGMIIMLVALAVHLFIREIPLRKQHSNSRHDHQT